MSSNILSPLTDFGTLPRGCVRIFDSDFFIFSVHVLSLLNMEDGDYHGDGEPQNVVCEVSPNAHSTDATRITKLN